MSKQVCLLSIDPQVDFCSPTGKLSVGGAEDDMGRLATFVKRCKGDIAEIIVTLDSHRTIHIAHPIWWVDSDGNHPIPFENGLPTAPAATAWARRSYAVLSTITPA